MTYVSPLYVRIPKRRKSRHRRGFAKTLGVGLAVVVIVPLTLVATLAGVGRLRPASVDTRADIRFTGTFGIPAGRLVWSTLSDDVTQSPFYLAEAETALPAPVVALASLPEAAETFEPPLVTGSLGASKLIEREAETARLAPSKPRVMTERPQQKAAKQRLASLSPVEIGTKPPEEEFRPKTALYDITAKVVYMPNGERLEAHSGLGRYMDQPAHFKLKMRGVTPPNSYRLKMRESLFHGVKAIRLLPENEKEMYGRDGILAHPYMLGPSGQSNGCVSFKYYDKFLQAFLRGEVEYIVVVAKADKLPAFARRNSKSAANTRTGD